MNILLDTCTIIYLAERRRLTPNLVAMVDEAAGDDRLFVSLISAWEIGMLTSKGKTTITKHPRDYFDSFLRESDAKLCDLNSDIMINAHYLPGRIHSDPMDRLLIETARSKDLNLMTSDRAILAYGAEGHLKTLAC